MQGAIQLTFPVLAVPKGRPRVGRHSVYTPAKTRAFERDIKQLARMAYKGDALKCPIRLCCTFLLPRPRTVKRTYPAVRPDLDNLLKAVTDACNGILWVDDAQIVEFRAAKIYNPAGNPSIHLAVFPLDNV